MVNIIFRLSVVVSSSLLAFSAFGAAGKVSLGIQGMTCQSCLKSVKREFSKLPQVASVDVKLKTGKALVTLKEGETLTEEAVRQTVKTAGYEAKDISFTP